MFLELWKDSVHTTLGLFWMAFWAFGFGYLISSMIQVFVTESRMRKAMGETGAKSVTLGTFFGFLSSSCSFAALSTTRSLFSKGAGLIPSLAFLLSSTNLVIELGIVISVFLGWQFVVAEYLGGILLIIITWVIVLIAPIGKLTEKARQHAQEQEDHSDENDNSNWQELVFSKKGWRMVAQKYQMEWGMVWKDVAIGFTVAGIIAAFVPTAFFEALFPGAGSNELSFLDVIAQTLIGPVAAFFTFIGSMGNIPLAAVLFGNGVSFAGVMAFIFSDLVVFPVLRIQAQYYGWTMALFILAVFLIALVTSALLLHYGFSLAGLLPSGNAVTQVSDRDFFNVDYTLFLNVLAFAASVFFFAWSAFAKHGKHHHSHGGASLSDKFLRVFTALAFMWIAGGSIITLF